jgi:regulator of cell morphogenesis and NO signaling
MVSPSQLSLAHFVTEDHRTARVFEKYHLDYCCRGRRSLKKACEEKGLKVEELLHELDAIRTNSPEEELLPWSNEEGISPSILADYIEQNHHQYVRNEIPLITTFLEKISQKHGQKHPQLNAIHEKFLEMGKDLLRHMQKEEKVLFPAIRELESCIRQGIELSEEERNWLMAPIHIMEMEHEEAGDEMEIIRKLSDNYRPPADACTTYKLAFRSLREFEQDLHRHIHLENNLLFPSIIELARSGGKE